VQTEDYGEYVCTATNELGVDEGVVLLESAGFTAVIINITLLLFVVTLFFFRYSKRFKPSHCINMEKYKLILNSRIADYRFYVVSSRLVREVD